MVFNFFKKKTIAELKAEAEIEKAKLDIEREKLMIQKESAELKSEIQKEKDAIKKMTPPHPFVKFVDSVKNGLSSLAPPEQKGKSKKPKKDPLKMMGELFGSPEPATKSKKKGKKAESFGTPIFGMPDLKGKN